MAPCDQHEFMGEAQSNCGACAAMTPKLDSTAVGSAWINKKTHRYYRVLGFPMNATNAQDGQQMVRYAALGSDAEYVREISEFKEKFVSVEMTTVVSAGLALRRPAMAMPILDDTKYDAAPRRRARRGQVRMTVILVAPIIGGALIGLLAAWFGR